MWLLAQEAELLHIRHLHAKDWPKSLHREVFSTFCREAVQQLFTVCLRDFRQIFASAGEAESDAEPLRASVAEAFGHEKSLSVFKGEADGGKKSLSVTFGQGLGHEKSLSTFIGEADGPKKSLSTSVAQVLGDEKCLSASAGFAREGAESLRAVFGEARKRSKQLGRIAELTRKAFGHSPPFDLRR